MDPCKAKCAGQSLCVKICGFRVYPIASGGDVDPLYYASHFNVGPVDDLYRLPPYADEGQKHTLRLVSTTAGRALIDVDHLAGPGSQIQLSFAGDWAELHYRACQWHLADHVGAVYV